MLDEQCEVNAYEANATARMLLMVLVLIKMVLIPLQKHFLYIKDSHMSDL